MLLRQCHGESIGIGDWVASLQDGCIPDLILCGYFDPDRQRSRRFPPRFGERFPVVLLCGVKALDVATQVAAVSVRLLVSAAASLPAWRAAQADPV